MFCLFCATLCCTLLTLVNSHALPTLSAHRLRDGLKIEPPQVAETAGANVSFVCSHSSDVQFRWDLGPAVTAYESYHWSAVSTETKRPVYYNRVTIFGVSRSMSGEITCYTEHERSSSLLIVLGVLNGGTCRTSSDCATARAICQDGICDCAKNHVRLRIPHKKIDICKEMIFSLYEPCEFDEQCTYLVDPRSVCRAVCVCAPTARDRRGHCVPINEISYNRSQEMYRVGLIAVTCLIILIVAVSLWVTLKKSCHEPSNQVQGRNLSQTDPNLANRFSIDLSSDKPPSYEDVLVTQNTFTPPPNFKDALKYCMTAKRLQRQVSAPAGTILSLPPKEQLIASNKGHKET